MTSVRTSANLPAMADRVGPGGRLHAFEPKRGLCTPVERSVFVNGLAKRSTVYEIALGDANQKMLLC